MIVKAFSSALAITIVSWTAGMILTISLRNTKWYGGLSLDLVKSDAWNKGIGLGIFKWTVKNTFFKYLNQKLRLQGKTETGRLLELRDEMTFAELSHLVGFVFVAVFAAVKLMNGLYMHAAACMLMNVLLNLYPSLLQQQNKRQIDRMIKKYG